MLHSSFKPVTIATMFLLSACNAMEKETESVKASPTINKNSIAGNLIIVHPNQGIAKPVNVPPKGRHHENSLETISLNGREIVVASQITPYSHSAVRDYVGSGQVVARYGFLEPNYIWVQGRPTTNMPSGGSAIYTGKAYHITAKPNATNIDWTAETKVVFNVDFSSKKLTGSITDHTQYRQKFPTINFVGNIQGNTFSAVSTQGNIKSNGYFYGDNAATIGGTYQNSNGTISGAFGASR